jgi:hypothetical protein
MDSNSGKSPAEMRSKQSAITQLSACLSSHDRAQESRLLGRLCRTPLAISENLDSLAQMYSDAGRFGSLLEFLLSTGSPATQRIALLKRIGNLAISANLLTTFKQRIRDIASATTTFRFRPHEYLRGADDSIISDLIQLKYAHLTLRGTADDLLSDAETIIPRIDFNNRAFDFLFSQRSDRTIARANWEHEAKLSRAIEHVISDTNMGAEINERFVDADAREAAVRQIDPSRGTLVLLAHVGFPTVRTAFFSDAFPAARYLSNYKKLSARIELAGKDQGLFEAYKSLKNSEMVLLAPDGLLGTNNTTIEVLGERAEIRDGAAFLAYESRCCTAWFTIGRKGTGFFPRIMRGPERRDDESFSEFKQRIFAFYELMLNNLFTGDPRNLVYGPPWISLFGRK